MGGRDYIDVMAASLLEVNHHVSQVFIINLLSLPLMGDGPVLAEDTAEVTVGEEDGARPILANQRYLLAEMGVSTIDHRSRRSPAEPRFPILPIHPALPRTELATLENSIGLLNPLS